MSGGGGGGGVVPSNQSATATETALAEIARDQWASHKKLGVKVEREYAKEAQRLDSEREKNRAAGFAASTFQQAAGSPTGGNVNEMIGRETAGATGLSRTLSSSDINAAARGDKAIQSVIGMGRDIENTGVRGLTRQAANERITQQSIANAENVFNESRFNTRAMRNANYSDIAGTAAGYGMYRYATRDPNPGVQRQTTPINPRSNRSASTYYDNSIG